MKKELNVEQIREVLKKYQLPMKLKKHEDYYEGVYYGFNQIVEHYVTLKLSFDNKFVDAMMMFETKILNIKKKLIFEKMRNPKLTAIIRPDGIMTLEISRKYKDFIKELDYVLGSLICQDVNEEFEQIRIASITTPDAVIRGMR